MKRRTLLATLALAAATASVVTTTVATAADKAAHPAANTSATVLVVGATGRSGAGLLDALRAGGYSKVRALVRDPASARAKVPAGIDLVQGDVRDVASLAKALEGVRNLATAAKAAGVKHYVQVSSLGVTNPNHPLDRFGKLMEWKLNGENALRASGVPYTIVRHGGLGDGPGGKAGIRIGQGDKLPSGAIPRADVGTVCVHALGNPDAIGRTFEIVSGEPGAGVDWATFFKGLTPDA